MARKTKLEKSIEFLSEPARSFNAYEDDIHRVIKGAKSIKKLKAVHQHELNQAALNLDIALRRARTAERTLQDAKQLALDEFVRNKENMARVLSVITSELTRELAKHLEAPAMKLLDSGNFWKEPISFKLEQNYGSHVEVIRGEINRICYSVTVMK